jgi:hypothetical protein
MDAGRSGTGLTPARICTGAHPSHICTGSGLTPAASAPEPEKRMQAAPRWRSKSWKMRAAAKWTPSAIRRRFVLCALASTRVLQSISSEPAKPLALGACTSTTVKHATPRPAHSGGVLCCGDVVVRGHHRLHPVRFLHEEPQVRGASGPKLNLTPFQRR